MENITLLAVPVVHKARCAGSRGSGSDGRTGSKMSQPSNSQQAQGNGVQTPPTTPTTSKPSAQPTLGAKFISAGLAACWADCVTFPLDLAKVKLQVQGEAVGALTASAASSQASGTAAAVAAQQFKYRGVFGTLHTVCKEEGFRAMYNGLVPGLQRQMCFASVRIGLYDSVKQMYVDFFEANGLVSGQNIGLRILAGVTTGGMAVVCAQPTDVVKVRMQAHKAGTPKLYSGSIDAYRKIAKHEGVKGLWRGALPNITRNAIVNTAELVSYDLIKEFILRHGWLSDNLPCHFVSAFGAGFCTTVVASPVDVVKTRYMNDGKGVYRGAFHCATTMFREGGFMTFYKGFMPSFLRLGSWNIVMFVSFEQLKRFVCKYQNQSSELPASQTFPQVKLNTDSNKQVV